MKPNWRNDTPPESPKWLLLAYEGYPWIYRLGVYNEGKWQNAYGSATNKPDHWTEFEGPGDDPKPVVEIRINLRGRDYSHIKDQDYKIYHGVDDDGRPCVIVQKGSDKIFHRDYNLDLGAPDLDLELVLVKALASISYNHKAADNLKDRPYKHTTESGCNLGDLKKFMERHKDLPDETPIFQERIHDAYFLNSSWPTLRVKSHEAHDGEIFEAEYFRVWYPVLDKDHMGNPIICMDNHF